MAPVDIAFPGVVMTIDFSAAVTSLDTGSVWVTLELPPPSVPPGLVAASLPGNESAPRVTQVGGRIECV